MRASDLYNDRTISCACKTKTIKGLSKSKLYSIYSNMKDRCYNSNHHEYKNYGGKNIIVCSDWVNNFLVFYEWSLNNGYKEGLSIDRINENGNYSPDNCQWISRSLNTAKANKTCQHRKSNNGTYYGVSPEGEYYEFDNANEFSKEHNLNAGCVRKTANGNLKSYKKWNFGFLKNIKK